MFAFFLQENLTAHKILVLGRGIWVFWGWGSADLFCERGDLSDFRSGKAMLLLQDTPLLAMN